MTVSTKTYAIAALSVVAIGLITSYAFVQSGNGDRFASCRTSRVSGGGGQIGGPFTLTNQEGRRVTDQDVLAKPSLVYFGYTSCPDICPTDTARNAEAVDALEDKGYDVAPVMISVDPGRDTPEVLKEWAGYIHPQMIALTGSDAEIAAVAREYKTYFKVPEDKTDPYYLVDHMTQTYLMLPGYGFADFFSRDATPEDMANQVACFIDAAR